MAREEEGRYGESGRGRETRTRSRRGEYEGIDLNRASEDELAELPMVGRRRAEAIVENRPYSSWEDLEDVPSISQGMIEDLRHGGATINGQNGGQRDEEYRATRAGRQRRGRSEQRGGRGGARQSGSYQEPIDLNEASREELMEIEGIGARTADNIISWREENGPFESVEDLLDVPGVSRRVFEMIRDQVTVGRGGRGGGRGREEARGGRERGGRGGSEDDQGSRTERGRGAMRQTGGYEEPIDLNEASREELLELEGISARMADRIIRWREENGPFESVEDLLDVPGVSRRVFEMICDQVTVGRGGRRARGRQREEAYGGRQRGGRGASDEHRVSRAGSDDTGRGRRQSRQIDLNTASVEDLQQIEGISQRRAEAIVEARERSGPFESMEDVAEAPGISDRMMDVLEREATVQPRSRRRG